MNKDKLLSKICPVCRTRGCCKGDEIYNCDDCNRVLEEWFDEYDKHIIEQYEANTKLNDTTRKIYDNVAQEMYCKGVDKLTERLKDYFVIPHDVRVIETTAKTVKETEANDYTHKKITTDKKDTSTSVQEVYVPDEVIKQIRANAIDDFVHKVKKRQYVLSDVAINSIDYGMFTIDIEQIAKQLKEQK